MAKPDQPKNALKGVRISDELVKQIDDWRRVQPDIPSQDEAIRRLVEAGLKTADQRRGKS